MRMSMMSGRVGQWLLAVALLFGALTVSAGALFKYGDREYQAADFSNEIRQSLYKINTDSYQRQSQLADLALFNIHLQAEAGRRGIPVAAMEREILAVKQPDAATVERFYEQNKSRIGAPLEQVRSQIIQYLVNNQLQQKRDAIISQMKNSQTYRLLLDEPIAPALDIQTAGYPSKGNPDAKVILVEFADYQCPHCRKTSFELKKLMQQYGDKVKLVFRDFPINRSGISQRVAEGAVCADEQGQFWDYHDMAYELQSGLGKESPMEFADVLGLDKTRFEQCLVSTETKLKVARSKAEAEELGISATPTIYINGQFTYDHDRNVDLKSEIEKALEASQAR